MPLYVDGDDTIRRITFNDDFVAEKPIKESWLKKTINHIWAIVFGVVR